MKVTEIILEATYIGRFGGFDIEASDHAYDKAEERGVSPREVNILLTRLNRARREIMSMTPHERFWVWDSVNKVLLGMRRAHDGRLFYNTTIRDDENKGDKRTVRTIKLR